MNNLDKDRGSYKRLQDHKIGFDQDALWNEIQDESGPRRSKGIWFWWIGALSLIVVGVLVVFNFSNESSVIGNRLEENTSRDIKEVVNGDRVDEQNLINSNESRLSSNNINTKRVEKEVSQKTKKPSLSKQSNNITYKKQINNSKESYEIELNNKILLEKKLKISAPTIASSSNNNMDETRSSENESVKSIPIKIDSSAQTIEVLKPSMNQTSQSIESEKNENLTDDFNSVDEYRLEIQKLPMSNSYIVFEKDPIIFNNIPNCNFGPERRKSFIELARLHGFVGYGKLYQRTKSQQQLVTQPSWLDQRSSQEYALDVWSAGLLVGHPLGKRLYVKAGFEYHRSQSKVKQFNTSIMNAQDIDPSLVPVDFQGGAGLFLINNQSTYYNTYYSISVPLRMQYTLPFLNKLFSVEGAVTYTILDKMRGKLIALTNEAMNIETTTAASKWSYEGRVNVTIPNKYRGLYVSPGFRVGPRIEHNGFKDQYYYADLRVGIVF